MERRGDEEQGGQAPESPVLPRPLQGQPPRDEAPRGGAGFTWLTILGFAFLTYNSGMAIYRSEGDAGAISFVVFSYVDLVLLFCCLRWFERRDPNSRRTRAVRACVCVLTALLVAMLAGKIATVMPLWAAVLVWLMAFATVLGGFYAFFLHNETRGQLPH